MNNVKRKSGSGSDSQRAALLFGRKERSSLARHHVIGRPKQETFFCLSPEGQDKARIRYVLYLFH